MGIIKLDHLTKIEGHATLSLSIQDGVVKKCELGSVEGSRYFEGLLVGHKYYEASEITSRICGICSCAHTIAAITAIEDALDLKPSYQTMELRKLLTLAERIRSHATHLYFLALPDHLGYESALAMMPKYKKEVVMALKMVKVGNDMVRVIGGRDMHPVSATVGGWLKVPTKKQMQDMENALKTIKDDAVATFDLFSKVKYQKFEHPTEYFSLDDGKEFPTIGGHVKSKSTTFEQRDYLNFLKEYHEDYSTANFVVREGKSYMVGSLSRMNNSFEFLSDDAKKLVKKSKFKFPSTNPFLNNFCQAVELVHSIDQAIGICKELEVKPEPVLKFKIKAGRGVGAVDVPRGILWHEYSIDDKGIITHANIITPTAQNLRNMQDEIRDFLPTVLKLEKESLVIEIEKLIRSYDPCFSCSTHFLEVKWE